MIFTSVEYVLFFAAVLLIRSALRNFNTEKWFLLIASYLFYMSWGVLYSSLILITGAIDYFVGEWLGRVQDERRRKALLVVSIAANLGVLAYFKYTNFLLDNVWLGLTAFGYSGNRWVYDIVLPAGISFFTFQSMTYTIEAYRRNLQPCHSLRDFLLFVAFFPQLLAGPINRAKDLLPQFLRPQRATAEDFEIGLAQFAIGAAKKLVISDRIAAHVDLIFAAPGTYDGFTLLQGAIGYGLQIYCDFSGYSDMAIGSARMMGFRFMENFQMPYSAVNITEFWRRWHISLSTWFRDYLYISLGGNRKGPVRTYINLFVTFLLCGLWHGASWNFVFWGGLHGFCLTIHKAWMAMNPFKTLGNRPALRSAGIVTSRLLTLGVVLIGWIFFRAQTWGQATEYVRRLLEWNQDGTRLVSPYILAAFAITTMVHLAIHKDRNWAHEIADRPVPVRVVSYAVLVLVITALGATDSAPFIYFQF
jgi:D-alanyl-lipoteichoic acid acyltransferase DltB (MBOAT superfamily)